MLGTPQTPSYGSEQSEIFTFTNNDVHHKAHDDNCENTYHDQLFGTYIKMIESLLVHC